MKPIQPNDRTLILGGYGTFGQRIAAMLCQSGYPVIINGRDEAKAKQVQHRLQQSFPDAQVSVASFDVHTELEQQLSVLQPTVVIHTCGPFQGQHTQVAETVIKAACHYIDLADSRDYVNELLALDDLAKKHQVTAITGASTVPTLSSAALAYLQDTFQIAVFDAVKIGISPGQRSDRGLATTKAVLSYLGKKLKPWPGDSGKNYGWQNTYLQPYPNISNRLMGNCEAPDLDCLSHHFKIKALRFSAGMESKLLHLLIWFCSWLVRLGLPLNLKNQAARLLAFSRCFDVLGTADGGMHVAIEGTDTSGHRVRKTWFIEAFENHGPQIPAVPAALLVGKILSDSLPQGAHTSINLVNLSEYLTALKGYQVKTCVK